MQDIEVHSWLGGMDQDTSKAKFQTDRYFEMWNGRVTTDSNLTTGAIENIRGNKDVIVLPNIPSSATLGLSNQTFSQMTDMNIFDIYSYQNDVIIFSTSTGGGNIYFQIWKAEYSNETLLTLNALTDLKVCVDITGTTITEIKRVICHYEYGDNTDGGIYKLYWTDGITAFKSLNLYENNIYGTNSTCLDITIDDLNAYNTSSFNLNTEITFSLVPGGNYKAGMVQYAYQLFGNSKSDTINSLPSSFIHLTSSYPDTSGYTNVYFGTEKGTTANKSVNLTISNIQSYSKYSNIRIFAIFYDALYGTPEIRYEEFSISSDNITITDSGDFLNTIPYTDFVGKTFNIFSCQDIAIKNNRLLACNIKYDNLLVDPLIDAYDTRAYRFASTRLAYIYNGTTATYIDGTTIDFQWSGGTGLTWLDIPITHDCINNDLNQYIFKNDGTTLGGIGPNISYTFISDPNVITIDNDINNSNTIANQANNFGNPEYYVLRGYQRDEVYSFGIQFCDSIGRTSAVKWIGDIKFPGGTQLGAGNKHKLIATKVDETTVATNLYIQFEVGNIPSNYSYRIVRCERTEADKTVLFSGLLSKINYSGVFAPTLDLDDTDIFAETLDTESTIFLDTLASNSTLFYYPGYNPKDVLDNTSVYGAMLYSPELSFYGKNDITYYTYKTGDYITYATNAITIPSPISFGRDADGYSNSYKVNGYEIVDSTTHSLNLGENTQIVNPRSTIATVNNIPYSNNENGKIRGTHLFLDIDSSTITGSVYAFVKRNVIPYGGNTYNDRLARSYIPCTNFIPYNTTTTVVRNGDTFINKNIHLDSVYSTDGVSTHWLPNILSFPCESTINTFLHSDDIFENASVNGGTTSTGKWFIEELYDTGTSLYPEYYGIYNGIVEIIDDLYRYNTVYSKDINVVKAYPEAANFNRRTEYLQRILYSDKKIIGVETTDAWINFPPINYQDVDGNYGDVYALNVYRDQLFFFQDKAFGIQPVEERITTNAANGDVLVLGEGDILGKYGYISYNSGCRHLKSIINTEENFHFYDSRLNRWNIYSGEGLNIASITGSMNSFFINTIGIPTKTISNIYGVYNSKHNGVIMTFAFTDASYYTISYNQYINAFESFHSFYPKSLTQFNNQFLSIPYLPTGDNDTIYLHNTEKGTYGTYYPEASVEAEYDLSIEIVSNKYPDLTKMYTNVEFNSVVYDSNNQEYFDGTTQLPDTFTKFRIYNDYQDSGEFELLNYNETL